jgi:hypothetical protein
LGSSSGSDSMPYKPSRAVRVTPTTCASSASSRRASAAPIDPWPTISTVEPASSRGCQYFHVRRSATSKSPLPWASSIASTHSATGVSRTPRALQSVTWGGTRPVSQSTPASSVWITRSDGDSAMKRSESAVPYDGTMNAASSNCPSSTSSGSAARSPPACSAGAQILMTARTGLDRSGR